MRNTPTGRQLRLGSELRKLRELAGLTATQAGQLLGVKQNQISNMEAGRVGVSPERVRTLARQYRCADQEVIAALCDMTADRTRGWWEEYREILPAPLLDLAEIEHHSRGLRTAVTVHIPGLLQTPEHAREIFRQDAPELSPPDIEHRVSFRIKRQTVLFRTPPTAQRVVIHEAALRMQFGGRKVAREQLGHLVDLSEHAHVVLQVIPFAAGAFAGSGQSIYYIRGAVPQLDSVNLDQSHGPVFLDAEPQLQRYRVLLSRIEASALDPATSRDFIHTIARNL
ncbi:helix-turn-helix transcriptional regulator [Streptomyces sp. HB132]|uniref:helix-turn-helix domain-containing protein n=1 Tax=Streptomyces sp. HB132 TaxID=767388 RepID=UPI00195F4094|nr:helix-turn-helix transcriptional regulator [Streptomyces sp. HB132]MBM7436643.1 transcriptional regulator with XRE-family HTH domain [Streptomyces sp. HB132]